MLASGIPAKFPITWGEGAGAGFIRPIPQASQIGIQNGAASLTDGFPPLTFVDPNAGGSPPWGQDFNGIFSEITSWNQWAQAGGPAYYDAAFSTAIGGYVHGSLLNAVGIDAGYWFSTVDNNTSNPDTGGANWLFCQIGQAANDARYLRQAPVTNVFVSPSGNDTTGTGTSLLPWATTQHAIDVLSAFVANNVTVNIGAGTYVIAAGSCGGLIPKCLVQNWNFSGSGSTTCIFNSTATGARGFLSIGPSITVSNVSIAAYYEALGGQSGGQVTTTGTIKLTNSTHAATIGANAGQVSLGGTLNVSGNGVGFMLSAYGAIMTVGYTDVNKTITCAINFTGTPVYSSATAVSSSASTILFYPTVVTFSGSVTGNRFALNTNGVINTQGQATTYIPGSITPSGPYPTGGQYA